MSSEPTLSSVSPPTTAASADVTMQDTTTTSDSDHDHNTTRQRLPQQQQASATKLPVPYILIENLSRSINYGTLLRCCVAYGMKQIIVVGYDKCSTHGSHGSSKHIQLIAFPTHDEAIHYIRHTLGCKHIIGVLGGRGNTYDDTGYTVKEIHVAKPDDDDNDIAKKNLYYKKYHETVQIDVVSSSVNEQDQSSSTQRNQKPLPKSYPIHINPFDVHQITGTPDTTSVTTRTRAEANDDSDESKTTRTNNDNNICFAVGKKTRGLPISLARLCDWYVHVPHVAVVGTNASSDEHIHVDDEEDDDEFVLLNMESCLSIVLHHFMAYAGYEDGSDTTTFTGQKYNVTRINKGELAIGSAGAGAVGVSATTTTTTTRDQRTQQRLEKKASLQQEANDASMADVAVDMFGNNSNDQGDY